MPHLGKKEKIVPDNLPGMKQEIIPDNFLHHRLAPNLSKFDDVRDPGYVLRTNAQSWMEKYSVDKKPAKNTFRIFYLGDSNTQGTVDFGYKMVDLVEQKLNMHYQDSGVHFEVINTGTSSYSILQYYLLSKIVPPHCPPDLVVINVV